jgi:hypothetical protein
MTLDKTQSSQSGPGDGGSSPAAMAGRSWPVEQLGWGLDLPSTDSWCLLEQWSFRRWRRVDRPSASAPITGRRRFWGQNRRTRKLPSCVRMVGSGGSSIGLGGKGLARLGSALASSGSHGGDDGVRLRADSEYGDENDKNKRRPTFSLPLLS